MDAPNYPAHSCQSVATNMWLKPGWVPTGAKMALSLSLYEVRGRGGVQAPSPRGGSRTCISWQDGNRTPGLCPVGGSGCTRVPLASYTPGKQYCRRHTPQLCKGSPKSYSQGLASNHSGTGFVGHSSWLPRQVAFSKSVNMQLFLVVEKMPV